jgi:hypothetical protein
MKITQYLSIIAIAGLFASCTIEGPAGPGGPSGENGANGVANISINTYTVTTWTLTSITNNWISYQPDTNITNYSNNAVEVYWSTPSDTVWLSMPHTNLVTPGDELGYAFNNGAVIFTYYGYTNATWPTTTFDTLYFNVAVIPPSIYVKYPNMNWKNYRQVSALPEFQTAIKKI